jgi:hypothetical protein
MKTSVHLCQYRAEFFSEWDTFQIKFADKIKTHISFSINLSLKSCRFWHNVEKCGKAKDDNVIKQMPFACRLNKATDTRSKYATFIAFQRKQWLTFIRISPALLEFSVGIIFPNSGHPWTRIFQITFSYTLEFTVKKREYIQGNS